MKKIKVSMTLENGKEVSFQRSFESLKAERVFKLLQDLLLNGDVE